MTEQSNPIQTERHGLFARLRQRIISARIRRISRKLDLTVEQQSELESTISVLIGARRKLRYWPFETGQQLTSILRDPETHADALKTEIDISVEGLQQELDSVSTRLVSLVSQLDGQQRSKLADMMPRHMHCACPRAAAN